MKKSLLLFGFIALLAGCGYKQANECIDSLYAQGVRYLNTDQWDSAMIVFSEAERLLNPRTDLVMKGKVYANLGNLWRNNGNILKAIEYKEKAWQAYDAGGDENKSALVLLKIGDYYSIFKTPERHEKALHYIGQAQTYQNVNDTTRGAILQCKALVYFSSHLLDSAITYFHKAYPYPDETTYKCINRLYLGISHFRQGQLDSAKLYVTEALTYPAGFRQRSGCHNMLRKIAEAQGDSAAYHYYSTLSISYKDSTMRLENALSRQVVAMDDKADALQDTKHRRQMTLITVALALVIIMALMVHTLRTRRHQQQQKDLQHQMQEAQSATKLAENIAREAEETLQKEQKAHQQMLSEKKNLRIQELQATYPPTGQHWSEKQWENIFHDLKQHGDLFLTRLQEMHPNLSKSDIRLCVLVILSYREKEMAHCLSLTQETINKKKQRIAKKMSLNNIPLRQYLLDLFE